MKYFYENYRVNMRIDTLAKCKPTYHLHLHKIYQIRVNVQKCLLPYTYIRYKILRSLPITNMINTTKIEYQPIPITFDTMIHFEFEQILIDLICWVYIIVDPPIWFNFRIILYFQNRSSSQLILCHSFFLPLSLSLSLSFSFCLPIL